MSKAYSKNYKIDIKMEVFINNIKTEKIASCVLEDDVTLSSIGIAQGNFKCSVSLTSTEYRNTNFKMINISSNNDIISGISDLDEVASNPYRTDEFIKDVKNRKAQGIRFNYVTDIFDYYSEKNNLPLILNIDSININECHTKGKLFIMGQISDKINETIKFDLPLTYPKEELKCQIEKANKNSRISITCKTITEFKNINNLIIETRLIKKRNKEVIFIKGKQINFGEVKKCVNYNIIKKIIAKRNQKYKFTFLQLNKFTPRKSGFNFFLALLRSTLNTDFYRTIPITIKITISNKRYLRNLLEYENDQPLTPVSCSLNSTLQSDLAAGYDCSNIDSFSGTPTGMEILTEEIGDISGIHENGNPDKLKYKIDFSNIDNLTKADELPVINITHIDGDTCGENGHYIITAKIVEDKNDKLLNKYNHIYISFSLPE